MRTMQSRRNFLTTLSAAGAAGFMGSRRSFADEGPPETTTIRLAYYPNNCLAPLLVAEDLLRAEGFTDIRYVSQPESFTFPQMVARGDVHLANSFAGTLVSHMDDGVPVTALWASGSTPRATSSGSSAPMASPWRSSPRARPTPFSRSRPSRRS